MDILLIALITFLGGLGYLLFRHGLTQTVRFEREEVAAMNLAYRLHIGDYTQSGKSMDAVYRQLQEQNVHEVTGFGLYYDNPGTTPKEELRALTGCIIPDTSEFERIHDIKTTVLPASTALVATFPYKSNFSIAMGALKVYTALAKYRKLHETPEAPVMEIYDMKNSQIIYVVLTGLEKRLLEDMAKGN